MNNRIAEAFDKMKCGSLLRLVAACGDRSVFIISPILRFAMHLALLQHGRSYDKFPGSGLQ
jgi:hypothetical protein